MDSKEIVLESLLKTGSKIEISAVEEYGTYYFYVLVDKLNLTGTGESLSEAFENVVFYVTDNVLVLLGLLYDDTLKKNEIPKLHRKLQKQIRITGEGVKKDFGEDGIYFMADLKRRIIDAEKREKIWIRLLRDNGLGDKVDNILK